MTDKSATYLHPELRPPGAASVGRGRVAGAFRRALGGLRQPRNWVQLMQFAFVGGTGYVVNLAVFAALVHYASTNYLLAAVLAFVVAVANNFALNRLWTFKGSDGRMDHEALRFFVVSVVALGFNLAMLQLLVVALDAPKLLAQAVAIACATPLNFVGNKLWTFKGRSPVTSHR